METHDSLYKELIASSNKYFVGLLGTIQSAIIGYLIYTVFQEKGVIFKFDDYFFAARTAISFLAIAMIWHEFARNSIIARWIPNFFDALVPFLFASAEAVMIFCIPKGYELWINSIILVWIFGILSYVNMIVKMKLYPQPFPAGANTLRTHVKVLVITISIIVFLTIVLLYIFNANELVITAFVFLSVIFFIFFREVVQMGSLLKNLNKGETKIRNILSGKIDDHCDCRP